MTRVIGSREVALEVQELCQELELVLVGSNQGVIGIALAALTARHFRQVPVGRADGPLNDVLEALEQFVTVCTGGHLIGIPEAPGAGSKH